MLASSIGCSLLPVGTGTRLTDDVDFVSVSRPGSHLIPTAFFEQRNRHFLGDGSPRSGIEIVALRRRLCDDHPITHISCLAPVRRSGVRALQPVNQPGFDRMPLSPQVVDFATVSVVIGPAGGSVTGPDAPCAECSHRVDDGSRNRLVLGRIENAEPSAPFLRRNMVPPLDGVTPAVEHRFVAPVSDGYPVELQGVRSFSGLAFEESEDSVSEVLVGLVVRRLRDLIVLLCDALGFLENCREISISHGLTEGEMRLRPSAGAEKLNQQSE
jgi:hypothetical protein